MTKAIQPAGVVGLSGGAIVQGPPGQANVSFDSTAVYAEILKRVHGVVKKAGRIAVGSARERAPVRKIFKGGRQSKPRFYTLGEAKAELPSFLKTEPRYASGRKMSAGQALSQLRQTPIATSRNKANLWQRTGTVTYRNRAARDDLGNPRKDEHGSSLFAAMRDIEYQGGRDRLFDRAAEHKLTSQGRYELKTGRATSFGQEAKASAQTFGKFKTEADVEKMRRGLDTASAGSEGQLGGNLRRSIDLKDRSDGDKPRVSIVAGGEDAPYARFVEFGTRHAAAQPFLRPALKHVEGPFKAMMRAEFPGSR